MGLQRILIRKTRDPPHSFVKRERRDECKKASEKNTSRIALKDKVLWMNDG